MARVAPKQKKEWRLAKVLRVLTFGAVVSLGIGLVAARSVYGDAKSSALSLGHELGKMGDVGTKRPIRLNGESMYLASTTEDMPVSEVLDRAEAMCKEHTAGMTAELENLSESLRQKLPKDFAGARGAGVLREDRGPNGMVACFARDDGAPPFALSTLVGRLTELVETGDLSRLGKLRYVFAERTRAGKTHIVAAWTDGPFNIHRLVPDKGDAPGTDAPNAPRPADAQRLLSADVEGVPYGVRIYDSARTPAEIVAAYDREMPLRGWDRLLGVPGDNAEQRAFTRQGVDLVVITNPDQGRTLVSVIEMRGR